MKIFKSGIQREGVYLRLRDQSIWVAKGCCDLEEGVVAVPRVVENRKIKRLGEAFEVIEKRYRHYLVKASFSFKEIPVIPLRDIEYVYYPSKEPCENAPRSIVNTARKLLNVLWDTGLDAYVTGSLLYCLVDESSDIDVVVYVDRDIKDLINMFLKKISPKKLDEESKDLVIRSVSENLDKYSHSVLLDRSLHEFVFEGFRVSIRYVMCNNDIKRVLCSGLSGHEYVEKIFVVRDDSLGIYTPSIYRASDSLGEEFILYSHRIRFANLRVGDKLFCRGVVEYCGEGFKRFNLDYSECLLI